MVDLNFFCRNIALAIGQDVWCRPTGHTTPYSRKRSTASCSARLSARKRMESKLRRDQTPLKVYCLESERTQIIRNALATGKSVSEYMRNVSIGYRVQSNVNAEQARELVRLKGDMGRLGGLLKLLLSNEERFDGMTGERLQFETIKLLNEIFENQKHVRTAIKDLIRN